MLVILSIEDNLVNTALIRRYVKVLRAHLLDATSGEEGIALAEAALPDLILLDLELPDMHGREVVARLKAHEDLRDVPVIALTAEDGTFIRRQCLSEGFDAYLVKPVRPGKLLSTINMLMTTSSSSSTEMMAIPIADGLTPIS